MPGGIGVNLRVSFKLSQGGRKYMEDMHISKFTTSENGETQLGFFGVFDGHGGREAAQFARDNLFQEVTDQELFWSESDDDILKAIRIGFINTHKKMWKELDKWPRRTYSGYQSTSGTTSTVAIVREKKLYIGHVGDSGIVLGFCDEECGSFKAKQLTQDHKPEMPTERARIERIGGSVASGKSGIQRVVWNRPIPSHKGPVRRSTQMVQIPFLAVARSLGDLWSYDYVSGEFAVSPEPDVYVMELDPSVHKCLVIGSDGLWNMLSPEESVAIVEAVEKETENKFLNDPTVNKYFWINHSRRLVNQALQKWAQHLVRADNTTAITILIDEYGPPKAQRLLAERRKRLRELSSSVKFLSDEADKHCLVNSASSSLDSTDGNPRGRIPPAHGVESAMPEKPYSLQRQTAVCLGARNIASDGNGTTAAYANHRKPFGGGVDGQCSPGIVANGKSYKSPKVDTSSRALCDDSNRSDPKTPSAARRPVTRGLLKSVPQCENGSGQGRKNLRRSRYHSSNTMTCRAIKRKPVTSSRIRSAKRSKIQ